MKVREAIENLNTEGEFFHDIGASISGIWTVSEHIVDRRNVPVAVALTSTSFSIVPHNSRCIVDSFAERNNMPLA